jgi:hypothetical protein
MKVICKDDTYHSNNKPILIVGKSYDVIRFVDLQFNTFYSIICEDGVERDIMSTRFLERDWLSENRERIINEILDESNL